MQNLQNPKSITWIQVLDTWRDQESWQNKWEEHFKSEGHENWDEWRAKFWQPLELDKNSWQEFEIQNPELFFSTCSPFPFSSWLKIFGNLKMTFGELMQKHSKIPHSGLHSEIQIILKKFPPKTTLIGLQVANQIFIFEGTKRATTLALAQKQGIKISNQVILHLTNLDPKLAQQFLKKL